MKWLRVVPRPYSSPRLGTQKMSSDQAQIWVPAIFLDAHHPLINGRQRLGVVVADSRIQPQLGDIAKDPLKDAPAFIPQNRLVHFLHFGDACDGDGIVPGQQFERAAIVAAAVGPGGVGPAHPFVAALETRSQSRFRCTATT